MSDQFRVPEKAPKEDEKRRAKQDEKEPEENPQKNLGCSMMGWRNQRARRRVRKCQWLRVSMTFQPRMTCCRIHREFHYQHFAIMASKVKHNDPVLPSHYKLNEPIPGPIYSEEWLQRVAQMPPCFFLEQVRQFQS